MLYRFIDYAGPLERLECRLEPYHRRGELDRELRDVYECLLRCRAERRRLDGWTAIAAAVSLEAGFQIGRGRGVFEPRPTLRRLLDDP